MGRYSDTDCSVHHPAQTRAVAIPSSLLAFSDRNSTIRLCRRYRIHSGEHVHRHRMMMLPRHSLDRSRKRTPPRATASAESSSTRSGAKQASRVTTFQTLQTQESFTAGPHIMPLTPPGRSRTVPNSEAINIVLGLLIAQTYHEHFKFVSRDSHVPHVVA